MYVSRQYAAREFAQDEAEPAAATTPIAADRGKRGSLASVD
jgi:hypothetical protein